jgi:hypothetical protein
MKRANYNLIVYTFNNFHQKARTYVLNVVFFYTDSFVYRKLIADKTAQIQTALTMRCKLINKFNVQPTISC